MESMRKRSPSDMMVASAKRQKVLDTPIQRNELVSALALASLALHSPKQAFVHGNSSLADEGRSPENTFDERVIHRPPITPSPLSKANEKTFHFDMSPPPPRHQQSIRPMAVPDRYRLPQPRSPYVPYHPNMYRRFMGPPPLPVSTPIAKEDKWICDYCNSESFTSYKAACDHEEFCCKKAPYLPIDKRDEAPKPPPSPSQWFSGSIPLAIPNSDAEWLSQSNSYIRLYCVEAFSATSHDVAQVSKRGRIYKDQVGIRCTFCAHRSNDRAVAAVSFPTSTAGIYESVKRWQRLHLMQCADVPIHHKKTLDDLQTDNSWIPTTRQYWSDAAKALGMIDTVDGIRFSRSPSIPTNWTPSDDIITNADVDTTTSTVQNQSSTDPNTITLPSDDTNSNYICLPTDQEIIPPYVYFLLRQVERCNFSESDRFVARSKGPVGFAGFQCKHCSGHAGLGKYFPLSCQSLGTNSTSQNIHAHLLKCRKVSVTIKTELLSLKEEKRRSPRLVPGWRKTFFELVWKRLHGVDAIQGEEYK